MDRLGLMMRTRKDTTKGRLLRERKTVEAMIRIACRGQHGSRGSLCGDCEELLAYSNERLRQCRFGAEKPTCVNCPVHCYKPAMRERIRVVMRYAGPRMSYRHPILTLYHFWDGRRKILLEDDHD